MSLHQECLFIRNQLKDLQGEAACLHALGNDYFRLSDYSKASEYYYKSLQISEQLNLTNGIVYAYTGIGSVHYELKEYEKALELYKVAYNIGEKSNPPIHSGSLLNNIGGILSKLNRFQESLTYFNKGLILAIKSRNLIQKCVTYSNIGYAYFRLCDYEMAISFLRKAMYLSKKYNYIFLRVPILSYLGTYYHEMKNFKRAISLLKKAIVIAEEVGAKYEMIDCYEMLVSCYKETKKYKKAIQYQEKLREVESGIFSDSSSQRIRNLQVVHEVNQAKKEAEKYRIENERKSRELQEAKAVQISMLPKEPPLLSDWQVSMYMQPAQEVGGDYYDFFESKDSPDRYYFILADAAGHGLKSGIVVAVAKSVFQNQFNEGNLLQTLSHSIRGLNLRGMFMGAIITKIYSGENPAISFQIAGMPPVIKYDGLTKQTSRILQKSLPLGIKRDVIYADITIPVNPGDTFLLFSDGLMELFDDNRDILDLDRIEEKFIELAHLPTHQIILELNLFWKHWSGEKQNDDITIQVFKYLG